MKNRVRKMIRNLIAGCSLLGVVVVPASGQVFHEDYKLTANDGSANDEYGFSVAIDENIIAVGAWQDSDNGEISGSAYLYDASTGELLFKLLPNDGAAGDSFGRSIAIHNEFVAIGAYRDDDNGVDSGSVYVFNSSTGEQTSKILPVDGAAEDWFGFSVDIHNGLVAVGSRFDDDMSRNSGSAYLFDASTGIQTAKLLARDGSKQDEFGYSIAISNGIVAVGALADDDNLSLSGSVYLYDALSGMQTHKLLPSDGVANDYFGFSVAMDKEVVVVGAYGNDDDGSLSGSAYIFNAASGEQMSKLLAVDGAELDRFGYSVAIDNGVVAVGARTTDSNGQDSGSVYLYDAIDGLYLATLLPSDGSEGDWFGHSVGVGSGVIVVGAIQDDDGGASSGSSYVFTTTGMLCAADFTGDGLLNFFDVSAFLMRFNSNNPEADINHDGRFNFFDISAFLQAFIAGCP